MLLHPQKKTTKHGRWSLQRVGPTYHLTFNVVLESLNFDIKRKFKHLVSSCHESSNVFTLQIPLKEGIGGESRSKDRVKTGLLYHNSNIACQNLDIYTYLARHVNKFLFYAYV